MVSKLEASRVGEKSCSYNVIKRFFFGQEMVPQFKGIENRDHEISFPRPWIWFSISYAKPTYYSDKWDDWGLDLPPLLMITFFCSVKLLILGRNLNEKDRQFTYFCIYSVMSLIGKTSVRHLTGAIAPQSLVPPLISSVGKIMIFKTFFPLLPFVCADPGVQASRL